jgi:hypothetical protein
VVIAAMALACLALNLTAAKLRADWLDTWAKPGITPLRVEISRVGPGWDQPDLSNRRWVAAEPPPSFVPRGRR